MRKATTHCAGILLALLVLSASQTNAQTSAGTAVDRPEIATRSSNPDSEFRLSLLPLMARADSNGLPNFGANMRAARSRMANPGASNFGHNFVAVALQGFPTITGNGTPNQIPMFTASSVIRNSIITQSKFGNIGIDTTAPGSKLTVVGMIETTMGGLKFPDGTIQTTAGLNTIFRDATLTGNGTSGSPLGIAIPLNLIGSDVTRVMRIENTFDGGGGIDVRGGTGINRTGGRGINVDGGSSSNNRGGDGVVARGGFSNTNIGGDAVDATGGSSNGDIGGNGVFAVGGISGSNIGGNGVHARGGSSQFGIGGNGVRTIGGGSINNNGGEGVESTGGQGRGAGNRGGHGILARPGPGADGATEGLAGLFEGNVEITGDLDISGNLTKGGGSFKIDHPLDPANKFLYHSFVESPDMMNVYNGNITTDASGEAVVALPEWFQALNRDFRYQLTVIGQFAQAIVASEIRENRFKIKTDHPNVKVSWQVTGIRRDPWAEKNRIPVEQEKNASERGQYLYPELYEKPKEKGAERASNSELMEKRER